MAISGSLLKINGTTVPNLKTYKVSYNKLWRDADRNMDGDIRATMVGIFPKLELEIGGTLTVTIVQSLTALLDQAFFSVEYYDPKTNAKVTANYYASDYTIDLNDRNRNYYNPFTVSLIPVSKRS